MTRAVQDSDPWESLKLAAPARRALAGAGLLSLRDLTGVTRAEVAALHGMGPRALTVLDQALYALGTEFKKVR